MDAPTAARLIRLDKRHVWHPFTQMQEWCEEGHEPLIITRGQGSHLWDQHERKYLDGNSSIWTNIHGHQHPRIDAAIRGQLEKMAHASFLGFTNQPAIELCAKLAGFFPSLPRVFLTDDGSTAMECALKMAVQYWQLQHRPEKCAFLAFDQGYHGDTLGAASLGGISTFQGRFRHLGLQVHLVRNMADVQSLPADLISTLAGACIEPVIQGAAGMKLWPAGMLRALREWCTAQGILLICDEVMTGFGRTGKMFACYHDDVSPDFLTLAKGLTGGYLPLAATLTSEAVFSAFLGSREEMKTFFYGHSYSGNALGCAAALASLEVFEEENTLHLLQEKIEILSRLLTELQRAFPRHIRAIRQCGLMAGIDVVADAANDTPYPWQHATGAKICLAAREFELLTRPILDTLIFMPPLCTSIRDLEAGITALRRAMEQVLD